MTLSVGLFLIGILGLSCLSTSVFRQQNQALAQQYVQTIKYRNLVIDLGNVVKTNATGIGPIQQYVLADIYAWIEAHSGLSHSLATTAATSNIANMTSSTNTTSNSSSGSK